MSGPVAIGVDLGGTKMVAGRVTPDGMISDLVIRPRPTNAAAMLIEPFEIVDSLITPSTVAIGLGVAGLVDSRSGRLAWGPNVPGENLAFGDLAEDRFGLPVAVDNDANCWALAEVTVGVAAGFDHVVVLTLGTGIGGGIITNGEVYRGNAFAGEFGHMVVDPGGLVCTCGNRGCWETLVSGRRLDELARRIVEDEPEGAVAQLAGGDRAVGRHLLGPALSGDRAAVEAYRLVGDWLGRGLASLAAVLDPQLFVIGGAVAEADDLVLGPARIAFLAALEGAGHRPTPTIVKRHLGAAGGAVGAGLAGHWLVSNP
ncbi:MAG: ROK family protein [Acidimicrobiia bacterium]|nr:ROK family protein [Acidimicrobiia bacterium]